ncbi:hypothetical protein JXA47_09045 [Candidatus Sumerlaeota bacterium]|nr:hypothetical protein [Candidatus Sumerlaeota bacterium]
MPPFDLILLDRTGQRGSYVIEAEDEETIVEAVREAGLHPLSIGRANGEVEGISIEELLAERRESQRIVRDTTAKIRELQERIGDGDDSVFDELRAALRIVISEEAIFPAAMRQGAEVMLRDLERLGPAGLREGIQRSRERMSRAKSGDAAAFDEVGTPLVLPGHLIDDTGKFFGEVRMGVSQDLVFLQRDERDSTPLHVHTLCKLEEFDSIRGPSLFGKKVVITLRDGRTWTIQMDSARAAQTPHIGANRLAAIIRAELRGRSEAKPD